ncbi:SpoIIIAH-like family protein [Paenibacillus sp. S150]|uniref:SpoIIIAH-like family protein n=1 Tax=Paenibacillus sp. S150 TaxID=2749826 RepID=UPI001C5760C2|nr:SpoIIIAH-like family protein [Paenibacillus sp. S150]MBW4081811.1 SpoIIIAH-like family protein [Paenibacillus sp. S150]
MKGKRQTIWLVSMLSLMVVLSAYYLFTEDSGASVPKETAGSIQVDNIKSGADGAQSPALDSGLVINEVTAQDVDTGSGNAAANDGSSTAAVTDDKAAATDDKAAAAATGEDSSAAGAVAADTGSDADKSPDTSQTATDDTDTAAADTEQAPAKDDAAILDEVASQSVSASSLFNNYLYEREQKNLKDQNDLLAVINDMAKTPSESAVATEQLNKLEEKESKITGIEEQLQQKYGEAIVKEEAGETYTVVVLSDKLDVKQAVGIVDLVMKELSITQDKIRVQYVSEQ